MRYSKDHKAETRKHLLETSGALAKEQGFASTGVDALVAEAGLTSGAFYSHFGSKAELFTELVEKELEASVKMFADNAPELPTAEWIHRQLSMYLNWKHVQNPRTGCAVPALGAEIARSNDVTKIKYEDAIKQVHDIWKERLNDDKAAWAVVSQLVGSVLLARAMKSEDVAKEILEGSREFLEEVLNRTS
ncbi:MAG: TetR/AcrR family transcriptional regulator [Gammaproteobacteria bacterium]|nr:TetR/AcrR family transcriptional regulator [Gammaproteobacteria bacterium]